jgi:hypothetical protein
VVNSANAINASYDKLSFVFLRDIAPVAGIFRTPLIMVVNPAVPAKTVPRVHRLRQGQSGQNQHGVARQRKFPSCAARISKERAMSLRGAQQ